MKKKLNIDVAHQTDLVDSDTIIISKETPFMSALLRRSWVVVLVHFLKRKKMLNKTVIGYDIYFLQSDYNHFVNTSRRP